MEFKKRFGPVELPLSVSNRYMMRIYLPTCAGKSGRPG